VTTPETPLDAALADLAALHAEVDARAAALAARHAGRLRCGRGCSACCIDGLAVFEVEAQRIARAHPELLAEGEPHMPGACAFLDAAGACRVYADRPYVCRTQGLPLRVVYEREGGEIGEVRDICELNLEGEPLAQLPEDALWPIGPFEERLAALQARLDGGAGRRVALRRLFRRGAAPR
jgi:Fe-S-cluster containining protein